MIQARRRMKSFWNTCFVIGLLTTHSSGCGRTSSVEDNETPPKGPGSHGGRSRLTDGSGPTNTNSGGECRFPLDLGTVVDNRRQGLNQYVLSSQIDSRCARYQEVRITIKTRQRLTLLGRFMCRTGIQYNEQVCTVSSQDIFSTQKTSINIPIIPDEVLKSADIEATAEFF